MSVLCCDACLDSLKYLHLCRPPIEMATLVSDLRCLGPPGGNYLGWSVTVGAAVNPLPCLLELLTGEMPNFGGHKVRRQMLGDISDVRIGDDRYLLDALVMVPDETKVGDHRSETVPTREFRGVDDEAGKIARCLDLGVNRLGKFSEVAFVQCGLGMHQKEWNARYPGRIRS